MHDPYDTDNILDSRFHWNDDNNYINDFLKSPELFEMLRFYVRLIFPRSTPIHNPRFDNHIKGFDLYSGRFCFDPELVKYVLLVKRDIFLLFEGYICRE